MSDKPLHISVGGRPKPVCPRCGSTMILIGRLTERLGDVVHFAIEEEDGIARAVGSVRSCYCNECGEVTLTLA